MSSPISIRKALSFAWSTYQQHYALLGAVVLTLFGAWVVLEITVIAGQHLGLGWWLITHLLFFILFAGLEVGLLQISLALFDGHKVSFLDVFKGMSQGTKFLIGQLIYTTMLLVGLILFIFPGVYLASRYALYGFFLTSKQEGRGLVAAFRDSAARSQGAEVTLMLLLLIQVVLNIVGASLLGIGLVITVPLSVLIMTSAYRQLLAQ